MEFWDPYENIVDKSVFYITENVPTAATEVQFQEVFSEGCDCKSVCTVETNCSCIMKYGKSYVVTQSGTENNIRDSIHLNYVLNRQQSGVFECHGNCKCTHNICGNRLVQWGPRKYLETRSCGLKGLGLFTTQEIRAGNFVCEYAGEVITEREATSRFKRNKQNGLMNYIICVREHFGAGVTTTFIDPSAFGNIGRYLNHSCKPNCHLVPVRIENGVPKLAVFALRHVDENTELTFDYGDGNDKWVAGGEADLKECVCGEANCRTWMPYCAQIK